MIDHRYMLHSNHKFLKSTPRECRGFEPPASRADKVVVWACVALVGLLIAWRFV